MSFIERFRQGITQVIRRRESFGKTGDIVAESKDIKAASDEEKFRIENECQLLLDKEDFGETDFDNLVLNMVFLLGGTERSAHSKSFTGLGRGSHGLVDSSRGLVINFGWFEFLWQKSEINIKPSWFDLPKEERDRIQRNLETPVVAERVSIIPPEVRYKIYLPSNYDSGNFISYTEGVERPLLPNEYSYSEQLTSEGVRQLCQKVFSVYQRQHPPLL